MNDEKLYKLEKRCPTCQFVLSEAKGLAYATALADERIVIFTDEQRIVLPREQAYALSRELPGLLCMIGRGSTDNGQGRKKQRA